ncbi:retrovirus-related Pol polyprotein from transposon RE2 [Trichonephila clavipes]|nr:retrovirus-related Pol polyprotein from transposon RE2 [Trichonephila clavipes]
MDKITIPDLNGTNYFIWELKMKAALSLKRLVPLILEEKPEDLTRKDEMDWITKNSDAIAYIKLSLADEQALQFAAEDNAKVLWDKIRATYMGEGEDRKIDAGNELKNIRMKNVADYIARARGISTKCHSLGLGVSPRELVYHIVRGLNGKFSKVRDILKTQRGKSMDEILQILREEEATLNLPIKTRMDGINEAFYSSHREEKLCDNIWILDSGASCHMAKESVWFKNISPEVMDIYLADKNSKMMSQGTGNVSAKTVSTKHCNSINLTITDVSYVPQLRCNLLSVTCLMDKGSKYENLTDKRIKKIRTDNGLEFVNEQLDTYLANSGIFHEKTIPYNSESNGKAERANRVLLERARSLLYESKLPLKFWAEAINCSTQVSNVTPRKGKEKIPLEIWTGRRGIMLGYARERRGYRIYDIKNQKVIEERSVKFNEYLKGSNYLDDLAIFCNNDKMYEDIVSKIKNVFEVVENKTNKFLGMEIEKCENGIYLSQCDYINSLLVKHNLENCKSVKTPIVKGEDKIFPSTNEFIDITMYQELIGELLYLDNRTQPDISFVMSYLSQFNHNPEKRHYNLAKRVLRYLMGSKDKKLFYENEFGILNASSDASWEMQKMENHFLEV